MCWGHQAGKQLQLLVNTTLAMSQQRGPAAEKADGILGCNRSCQFCQQVEGGDAAPLLSTGDAMPGALHLVLHSSVRETWTYCREFWATEMFERLKHTREFPSEHQQTVFHCEVTKHCHKLPRDAGVHPWRQ